MADMKQNSGVFHLHKRELMVVVITTLTLVAVVVLMTAHILHQDLVELSARSNSSEAISNPAPHAADPIDREKKPAPVAEPVGQSILVVVEPAPPSDEPVAQRVSTGAEPQEPPAPSRSSPVPEAVRQSTSAPSEFMGRTTEVVASIIAVAVVAPLVFAFCFFTLLRRHMERFGALMQIQNAVTSPVGIGPLLVTGHGVVPATFAAAESIEPARDLEDELPEPAGGAVFEQLFAETLDLQTQLDRAKR